MVVLRFYILRVMTFLAPFIVYCSIGLGLVFSSIFATVTGVCLSYLFLNKQRQMAAGRIAEYFAKPQNAKRSVSELKDNEYEDLATQKMIDS